MNPFRFLMVAALVLATILGGSEELLGAGKKARPPKPPKRPAPKVHRPKARPKPKPKKVKKPKIKKPPKKKPPKVKKPAPRKVKPPPRKPANPPKTVKNPKNPKNSKDNVKNPKNPRETVKKPKKTKVVKKPRRPKIVHKFATFDRTTRRLRFNRAWWYRFVVYPNTVDAAEAFEADYDTPEPPEPPAEVEVTPPVIEPGQGLPISRTGLSLTALLNGMDVENHWLPGKKVDWKTGNALGEEGGPASNGGAFVAAVCARLKVPLLSPAPANFLSTKQYDWLVSMGKSKGWVAVEPIEAQLLANQGWVVIAAWKNGAAAGERTIPGLTAIVRPDGKSAADIPTSGPRVILAATANHSSISLKEAYPAEAVQRNEVVFLAHRPGK